MEAKKFVSQVTLENSFNNLMTRSKNLQSNKKNTQTLYGRQTQLQQNETKKTHIL